MLSIGNTSQNKYFILSKIIIKYLFKPVEREEQCNEASFILGHFYRHLFLIVTGLICLIYVVVVICMLEIEL